MTLTVIIRNSAPMMFENDPPTHRSVQIELTQEQTAKIALAWIGRRGTDDLYEEISQCFIEPQETV